MAVADYARRRVRLWSVGGLWAGVLLTAFNLYAALTTYGPQFRVRNDFRLIYGAARDGWTYGYSHLYDLSAQKQVVEGLGQGTYWSPYLNPPPLAWLGTIFLPLPFELATLLWTALLIGAALLAWRLAAPGDGLSRAAHLALFLGLFPTAFGLMVGQPVVLVAAAVALAWWLAARGRPGLAGLALSLLAIKPQLALLVPLCLLVSGHWRVVVPWAVVTTVMVALALVLLGGDGLQRYRDALSLAAQWEPTRRYAIAGPLGLGPQVFVVEAIVVVVALVAAWRQRNLPVGLPIATGLVASLLFTPYVGFQDFAMLVVAGWLVVRSGATAAQIVLLVVGYALLELALVVLAVPILLAEACFLLSMLRPGDSARLEPNARLALPGKARLASSARNAP